MANILNIYDKDTGKYVSVPAIKGADGHTPVKGVDYVDGIDGKSAYEIALDNGFVGTEKEWLESLKSTEVATDVEDIYQVALENGGCVKGYEYLNPDQLFYNTIKAGSEIPTDSPVFMSGVSLYNILLENESDSVYNPDKNAYYDKFINACGHQWVILASTVENLETVFQINTTANPAYLLVYDIKHKCLRIILYPDLSNPVGVYTFKSIATLYDNDVQRLESFNLPASKWYPVVGVFSYEYNDVNNDRIDETFDIPEERIEKMYTTVDGDFFNANYDPKKTPDKSLAGQPYKFVLKQTEYPMVYYYYQNSNNEKTMGGEIVVNSRYTDTQKEILNQLTTDIDKELVYYTKEEWSVLIEQTPPHFHKCNDIIDLIDHKHKKEDIVNFAHTHVVSDLEDLDLSVYIDRPLQESATLNGNKLEGLDGEYYDSVPTVGYLQDMLDDFLETQIEGDYATYSHKHSEYLTSIPSVYVTETELRQAISEIESEGIDLSNYYTKEQTYNKTEVDNAVANVSVDLSGYLKYEVVTSVPATQEEGVLYIVTE